MALQERVYIQDRTTQYKAILNGIDWTTFCVSWTKNSTYELDFTIYPTNSYGYTLLTNENIIIFRGQQFLVKTFEPQYASGTDAIAITATHIAFEMQYLYQPFTEKAGGTYTVQQLMHFLFDGQPGGFSWQVQGNFPSMILQNDLGPCNAKDGLSSILKLWNCAVTFNNKEITVWSNDAYLHKVNQSLRYEHDTDQITVTGDSTGIINAIYCMGATDDNNNPKYFAPFWYVDTDSQQKWGNKSGGEYSNQYVTTKVEMQALASQQLVPNPAFSITVTYYGSTLPEFGSLVFFELIPMHLKDYVEVTGYKVYPFSTQTAGEIDLNSLQPNILQINQALENNLSSAISTSASVSTPLPVNNVTTITVPNGSIQLSLNGNVVYLEMAVENLTTGILGNVGTDYTPQKSKEGNLIVTSTQNYIINYLIDTKGNLSITSITTLNNQALTEISGAVSGGFNYII